MKMKARVLMDLSLVLGKDDRYTLFLKVFEVQKNKKFPDGIKAKFVMVDTVTKSMRLLVDNHEPYGFHMHSKTDKGATRRITLDDQDYQAALRLFRSEVERIIENEEK